MSQHTNEEYTIAIICPLEVEMSAFRYMMDDEHDSLPQKADDTNHYILGDIFGHNVVLTCLSGTTGKSAAATVATHLARSFPNALSRLIVGTGAGVPNTTDSIQLGDVVISFPRDNHAGISQYDLGRVTDNGSSHKGYLFPTPVGLTNAVQKMKSDQRLSGHKIDDFLSRLVQKGGTLGDYRRPTEQLVAKGGNMDTLRECDLPRSPKIHYGLIASGDRVVKSEVARTEIVSSVGNVLCIEMEAAGVATSYGAPIIRGISDFADANKTHTWQLYASAVAAACAKELISHITPNRITANANPNGSADHEESPAPQWQRDFRTVYNRNGIQNVGNGSINISQLGFPK